MSNPIKSKAPGGSRRARYRYLLSADERAQVMHLAKQAIDRAGGTALIEPPVAEPSGRTLHLEELTCMVDRTERHLVSLVVKRHGDFLGCIPLYARLCRESHERFAALLTLAGEMLHDSVRFSFRTPFALWRPPTTPPRIPIQSLGVSLMRVAEHLNRSLREGETKSVVMVRDWSEAMSLAQYVRPLTWSLPEPVMLERRGVHAVDVLTLRERPEARHAMLFIPANVRLLPSYERVVQKGEPIEFDLHSRCVLEPPSNETVRAFLAKVTRNHLSDLHPVRIQSWSDQEAFVIQQ
jgi:hypothetical protein